MIHAVTRVKAWDENEKPSAPGMLCKSLALESSLASIASSFSSLYRSSTGPVGPMSCSKLWLYFLPEHQALFIL